MFLKSCLQVLQVNLFAAGRVGDRVGAPGGATAGLALGGTAVAWALGGATIRSRGCDGSGVRPFLRTRSS